MKKIFLLIFLLLFFYASFCQKINWQQVRIDSFLSVSLPENFLSIDTFIVKKGRTFSTKIFKATTSSCILGVTVTQTDLNINPYDLKSMEKAYEGVKHGFKKNAESQGYSIDLKDTIVNNVPGLKADVFTDDSRTVLNRISYVFCVNTLNYSIIAAPIENRRIETNEKLEKILQSIRFNKVEILANASLNSVSPSLFDKGEKIGQIETSILLIAGVIIFIVYKRNSKLRNRTYSL